MGIYKRPDSPFYWLWIEGTNIRQSTGIPKSGGSADQDRELRRQAEAIYAARKTDHAKADAGLIVTRPTIGFRAFAKWFEQHETSHHRSATREASMLRQLELYFSRFEVLTDITEAVAKEWMTWRARQVARGTVNRELDVLKQLLHAAVPKYLPTSPLAGFRRFRIEEHEPRVLTHDEERRLIDVGTDEDVAWLLTALDTLMRLSNIVYLKWAQVKFPTRTIVPLNAKVKHDIVPISSRMLQALKGLPHEEDWVFPSFHRRGTGTTAPKNRAIRRFDILCQLAQVPHGRIVNGVTFHCLRHTGATRALQNGASVRTVMKLGGWRDEKSVMRYVHAADSDVRDAAESIGTRSNFTLVK